MTATNNIPTPQHSLYYAISPHPFAAERMTGEIAAGDSIARIIATLQPDPALRPYAHVYIDGDYIPQNRWTRVRPKAGHRLTIRMVPMGGGGGKNPLRTVLSLAVMAAVPAVAAGLGSALGGTLGSSFMGIGTGKILTTGVNLLGRLALNAIAPPARRRQAAREAQTQFIRGARNQLQPFGRVPMVLGKHRMVPPLAAPPYTETVGNDQYLRMLFVWGYGPLDIADLKIGETPIDEFDGVEIETRRGMPDDAPLSLYSRSVQQNDMDIAITATDGFTTRTAEAEADEISVDITFPRGLFGFDGKGRKYGRRVDLEIQYAPHGTTNWSAGVESYIPVAAKNAVALSVKPVRFQIGGADLPAFRRDLVVMNPETGAVRVITGREVVPARGGILETPKVPAGFVPLCVINRASSDADIIAPAQLSDARTAADIAARFEGSADFNVTAHPGIANAINIAAGGLKHPGVIINAQQTAALRRAISFKVPRGQYDVRVRRITADSADENIFDACYWTALRTVRYETPVKMPGIALTAVRIRATDQLSGVIDRFNGVVQSIVPDWTGSAWVAQATSNPASLFRHVLQGAGNARPLPDTRIDLARLQTWHDNCRQEGRAFNAVIDYDTSVREVLRDIAACGRASPAVLDGKWAVVEDRAQDVPVQHFTPANTFGFRGQKAFDELPHALRIRFINAAKGWEPDERLVFDDGYSDETATLFETLDLPGVTDAEQAWRDGRYHIATARLRPETYSFNCDIEHIVCTRGDLVRFTHDVPLIGIASARVREVMVDGGNVTGIRLDNRIFFEAEKTYAVRLRLMNGTSLVKSIDMTATATGVLTGDLYFTVPEPVAADIAAGMIAQVGESGRESVELIVKSIEPQSNLTARLTLVDAAPAVHMADQGVIPAFNSQITLPPELQRPLTPKLDCIQSGEEVVVRNAQGVLEARIMLTLKPPAYGAALAVEAMIRPHGDTVYTRAATDILTATAVMISGVDMQGIYDIQLRYVTTAGVFSAPLTVSAHRVAGISNPPAPVADFAVTQAGDSLHLTWRGNRDIDLDHYIVRYTPDVTGSAAWESAQVVLDRIPAGSVTAALPALSGSYFIKAVDSGGRQSVTAAMAVTTAPGLLAFNVVATVDESATFGGQFDSTGIGDLGLQLAGIDSIEDWIDIDAVTNTDIGNAGMQAEGAYDFGSPVDLGQVYLCRVSAEMNLGGLDLTQSTDSFGNIDSVESFDQSGDPAAWGVRLWIATTEDDPAHPAALWTAYAPFTMGDYRGRGFRFRVTLMSEASMVTPTISLLRVHIDMPDRTVYGRNLTAPATAYPVTFARAFHGVPAVAVTAQAMAAGDYYTVTAITPAGFTIAFFNAGGTPVSRSFDYVAAGYGVGA